METKASPMMRVTAGYHIEQALQEHDLLLYQQSMGCASAGILALNNPNFCIAEMDCLRNFQGW
jgi:hypothetical protein